MTTVTAKELREHLSDIIDRVEAGEEVVVIRRSRPAIRLIAEPAKKSNGAAIVAATERYYKYIDDNNITFNTDPDKSIKELYHELMDTDPKYARYVNPRKK